MPLKDGEPFPTRAIEAGAQFIHENISQKKRKVLVNCAAGVSRAPSMVICYMHQFCGWGVDEAIQFLRTKRPVVNPNPVILQSIKEYFGIDVLKELEALR